MFTTVERHRRMPYLKNLVGQVAPQALPDLRENSLYETLKRAYNNPMKANVKTTISLVTAFLPAIIYVIWGNNRKGKTYLVYFMGVVL